MLCNWWDSLRTCTYVRSYAADGMGMVTFLARAHMWDAMQLMRFLALTCEMRRNWWGGDGNIHCTCAHVRCYIAGGVGWILFEEKIQWCDKTSELSFQTGVSRAAVSHDSNCKISPSTKLISYLVFEFGKNPYLHSVLTCFGLVVHRGLGTAWPDSFCDWASLIRMFKPSRNFPSQKKNIYHFQQIN